jgi:hypothetical protein
VRHAELPANFVAKSMLGEAHAALTDQESRRRI